MTATIIILPMPVAPRATAIGNLDEIALPALRLPRRVYGRLLRQAKAWNVDPQAAAEMLLLQAINDAAGIKQRR